MASTRNGKPKLDQGTINELNKAVEECYIGDQKKLITEFYSALESINQQIIKLPSELRQLADKVKDRQLEIGKMVASILHGQTANPAQQYAEILKQRKEVPFNSVPSKQSFIDQIQLQLDNLRVKVNGTLPNEVRQSLLQHLTDSFKALETQKKNVENMNFDTEQALVQKIGGLIMLCKKRIDSSKPSITTTGTLYSGSQSNQDTIKETSPTAIKSKCS